MRVIFTDHVADDTGRLLIRPIPIVVELVHRKQNSPVHGLEAIAGIGEGATDNHAHGVIEVTASHFLFEADRQSFFGKLGHDNSDDIGNGHFRCNAVLRAGNITRGIALLSYRS